MYTHWPLTLDRTPFHFIEHFQDKTGETQNQTRPEEKPKQINQRALSQNHALQQSSATLWAAKYMLPIFGFYKDTHFITMHRLRKS